MKKLISATLAASLALSLAALLPATVQRNCTDSESSQSDELCERSGGV